MGGGEGKWTEKVGKLMSRRRRNGPRLQEKRLVKVAVMDRESSESGSRLQGN